MHTKRQVLCKYMFKFLKCVGHQLFVLYFQLRTRMAEDQEFIFININL